MKAVGGLSYLALGGAVVLALLIAVSCGGDGGEPVAAASPQVSPAILLPTPTVPAEMWRPPASVSPLPVSESDQSWRHVAATATSIDPILRPTYLPSAITQVWSPEVSTESFHVLFSDSSGQTGVSVAAGPLNPGLPGPNSLQESVEVRGLSATYQLQDEAEPLGSAYVVWEEPGRLGDPARPAGPHLDHVTYMVGSTGLPREELLKVANSLEPVER